MLEYRNRLGRSALSVSPVGLGCMSLDSADKKNASQIIHKAFDLGINYFDTADLYERGKNEMLVGDAVRSFRKDIILATKVGNQWIDGVEGSTWNARGSYIVQAVERSLKRLGTDYIDLYQLHGGMSDDDQQEVVEVFESLVKQGKIRSYGISSIRPNVFSTYLDSSNIASNMMQFSLLDTRPEEFFSRFKDSGVSIVARGSMAQGYLLGKPIEKKYLSHSKEQVEGILQTSHALQQSLGVSAQTLALKYCLDNAVVSSAVVGVRTLDQLADLKYSLGELLTIKDVDLSDIAIPKIFYEEHRD